MNFMNDPLGAMSKGLAAANTSIQTNVKSAADKIKSNEQLKQQLASAKERASIGMQYASESAGSLADKVSNSANSALQQNYHGRALQKATTLTSNIASKVKGQNNGGELDDGHQQEMGTNIGNDNFIISKDDEDELDAYLRQNQDGEQSRKPAGQEFSSSPARDPLSGNVLSSNQAGSFPLDTSNFSNPLGTGFNPFNPLAPAGTGAVNNKPKQAISSMNTLNDPLGGNAISKPQQAEIVLEKQLDIPKEFENEIIQRLCEHPHLTSEINKVETNKIKLRNKSIEIIEAINSKKVDIDKLNNLAFSGIPSSFKGLRSIIWRIILKSLPEETDQWQSQLDSNYQTYEQFKKELIVNPQLQDAKQKEQAQAMMDHPLSRSTNSVWNTFFKDQEIWDEIEKDVKRTRTEMGFFKLALNPDRNKTMEDLNRLDKQAETKKADLKSIDLKNYIETHADVLHRVLFIYAKLNPGIKYIQGMNEVLAVIYYCFLNPEDTENQYIIESKYIESDLFFSFTNIMTEMKDGFLRELDKEKTGIQGRIKSYAEIMKVVEPHAYHTIQDNQVNHQFYSLRWFMLLLCQEFKMNESIRLWDTLLTDPSRFNFTNFVCVSMVSFVRDDIIDGDFSCCMENLQKASERVHSIEDLLNRANFLCKGFIDHELEYDGSSQYTLYETLINSQHV